MIGGYASEHFARTKVQEKGGLASAWLADHRLIRVIPRILTATQAQLCSTGGEHGTTQSLAASQAQSGSVLFPAIHLRSLSATQAQSGAVTASQAFVLARTTSGILFFDDFIRSDRALNGDNGWVDDANTWSIVSNVATSSGQNFARCRNTGMTPVTGAVWEARAKAPSSGIYHMLRYLVPSASDDYHLDMQGNNGDKALARAASSDTRLANGLTCTMDTNYHVVKALYIPTQKHVIWFDHSATPALGSLATPFNGAAGPTAAGVIGMMGFGGAPLFDWVLVSSDHVISAAGLSGTQAFRLFDGSNTVIGSSGTQSGGTATLDIATLVDGLTTGYIKVFTDTGWGTEVAGARYPSVGNATDICGGDLYTLS